MEVIDIQDTILENLILPVDNLVRRRPGGALQLGVHTGKPYSITDAWSGSFEGQIYVDPSRSRYR